MRLAMENGRGTELSELHLRIEAARFEVQSLRLSRSLNPRPQSGPKRTESPLWMPAVRCGR
jgi:hypothetical protein